MEKKYKKYIIYALSILIIYLISYFFIIPILQYQKFVRLNYRIVSIKNTDILKKQSIEKLSILSNHVYLETQNFDQSPNDLDLNVFDNAIINLETYLQESKNIFIHPNVYEILSNAYFVKYKYTKNQDDIQKSYVNAKKMFDYANSKQSFIYRFNLATIDIGNTKEGIYEIEENYKRNENRDIDEYYLGISEYYAGNKYAALEHLELLLASDKEKNFVRSKKELVDIYYDMMKDFYNKKDYSKFLISVKRLAILDTENKEFFEYLIKNTTKTSAPYIKLNY